MCLDSYRAVCSQSADLEFVSLYLRKKKTVISPALFYPTFFLRVIGSSHMATCPRTIRESCFYLPYCYGFGPVTFFNLGDCINCSRCCVSGSCMCRSGSQTPPKSFCCLSGKTEQGSALPSCWKRQPLVKSWFLLPICVLLCICSEFTGSSFTFCTNLL